MKRKAGFLLILIGIVLFLLIAGTYIYQQYVASDVVFQKYISPTELMFTALLCLVFILIGINFSKRRIERES